MKAIAETDAQGVAGVFVVTDGAAGNERQALALAQAMRLQPQVLRIALRPPWLWIGPGFVRGARYAITRKSWQVLSQPSPALVIGCGRQAAFVTRALREASGGATYALQILDPRIDTAHFDLVIAPRHDAIKSANVIQTIGSLNPIDDAWLAQAKIHFSTLQHLPQPRTALLVGGPRRGLTMDEAWFARFVAELERSHAHDGGSMLITTSRRTPALWREHLIITFRGGNTRFWDGVSDGENPYAGYLAAADRIVVTPDSVNMLSEACATGAPVFTSLPPSAPIKLAALHAELTRQGWLHDLYPANVDTHRSLLPPVAPLRETATVASKVWQHLQATRPDVVAALDLSSS